MEAPTKMDGQSTLIVDTRQARARKIARALSAESITSVIEPTLKQARQELRVRKYDIMVICENVANRRLKGFCRSTRWANPKLIMVASLGKQRSDLEEGLFEIGLDDVITDRTSVGVLVKRILLRLGSCGCPANKSICLGEITVDFESFQVHKRGRSHPLTKGLAKLLKYFIQNRKRVITRREVTETLWVDAIVDPEGRNLDMQIVKLRRLIERDPKNPVLLQTIHGVGYMFSSAS